MISDTVALVSIITPCYNGERYLDDFLNSILNQDYPRVEVFFVDDGSTDRTKEIVDSYVEKFAEKGYAFSYIYQENAGQSVAVNAGLRLMTGEYYTWVDSDDILRADYVSKKVEFLENHKDLDMVISPVAVINGNDICHVVEVQKRIAGVSDNFFNDIICFRNVFFPPGGYMVRRSAFIKMFPSGQIVNSREGQNIQLLLPIAYLHTYGYLDECLYYYVIHGDSHSHTTRSYEEICLRSNRLTELVISVIKSMPISNNDKDKAILLAQKESIRRRFLVAKQYHQIPDVKLYYKKLRGEKLCTARDFFLYFKAVFFERE